MEQLKTGILFQDGCVLQRQKEIAVWGEGPEGEEVTVALAGSRAVCRVENGSWRCTLPPMEAAEGLCMEITCQKETLSIRDVSVGEVWIAGGQSNMEFFLCYDAQWEDMQCAAHENKNPRIHMFNVPRLAFPGHDKDVSECGYWFEEEDDAWPYFSAPGYSFARSLQPVLGVPVGIIGCNWGGTSASTWLEESWLKDAPLDVYLKEYEASVAGKDPEELKAALGKGLCPGGLHGASEGVGRRDVRNRPGRTKKVDEKAGRPGKPHGSLQCGTPRRPVSSDAGKNHPIFSEGCSLVSGRIGRRPCGDL